MPRFQTNLLIRDNRPQLFAAGGAVVHTRQLSDEEFATELRRKLVEEAQEAATVEPEKIIKELADVWEVMRALAELHGATEADILAQAAATRAKLGGFEKRLYSESIESPEGHENTEYHRQFPEKYPEIIE